MKQSPFHISQEKITYSKDLGYFVYIGGTCIVTGLLTLCLNPGWHAAFIALLSGAMGEVFIFLEHSEYVELTKQARCVRIKRSWKRMPGQNEDITIPFDDIDDIIIESSGEGKTRLSTLNKEGSRYPIQYSYTYQSRSQPNVKELRTILRDFIGLPALEAKPKNFIERVLDKQNSLEES